MNQNNTCPLRLVRLFGLIFSKRTIAIILCAAMLTSVLSGCNDSSDANTDDSNNANANDTINEAMPEGPLPEISELYGYDFDRAFSAFPPDTAMLIINGGEYTIAWDELFAHLFAKIQEYTNGMIIPLDWSSVPFEDESATIEDFVMLYALNSVITFVAGEEAAKELGISVTDADMATIMSEIDEIMASYDDYKSFLDMLWTAEGISSWDLFMHMYTTRRLTYLIFLEVFGEGGDLLEDETIEEFTQDAGYMMTKHIFRWELGYSPEEPQEDPLPIMQHILDHLNDYEGDDLDSLFDQLMHRHSEDTDGLAAYPEGNLFQFEDMPEEFAQAAQELAIGEFSEIIGVGFGYHIIYRIPLNYDVVPAGFIQSGASERTLREAVANMMFDYALSERSADLDIEFTPEFESINLAEIFRWHGAGN